MDGAENCTLSYYVKLHTTGKVKHPNNISSAAKKNSTANWSSSRSYGEYSGKNFNRFEKKVSRERWNSVVLKEIQNKDNRKLDDNIVTVVGEKFVQMQTKMGQSISGKSREN